MYYGNIKKVDIANGPGVRVSLFVSGCRNHCDGCFNPETWDFFYGQPFTEETEKEIIEALRPSWIQGLSILGGEPMEPENTGYRLESVSTSPMLDLIDVLVDGPFIEDERDAGLAFRGSRNQRIIRMKGETE